MQLYHVRLLLLALSIPIQPSHEVWTCIQAEICSPRLDTPPNVVADIQKKLETDALAEWKYRFGCDGDNDYEGTAAAARDPIQLKSDSKRCDPDHPELNLKLPGVDEMQYGYNIVDDYYRLLNPAPALDVTSRSLRNSTVYDPISKSCYNVPDAFSSLDLVGVRFELYFPKVFKSIGAELTNDHRSKAAHARWLELSLGMPGYESGFAAAFSRADVHQRSPNPSETYRHDESEIFYAAAPLQLYVLSPIPNQEVLDSWRNLLNRAQTANRSEIEDEFNMFFWQFGTHYFASAAVGGRCDQYRGTTADKIKTPASSDPQMRANCIAAELSVAKLNLVASIANESCEIAFPGIPQGPLKPACHNCAAPGCGGRDCDHAGVKNKCSGGDSSLIPPTGRNEWDDVGHDIFLNWVDSIKKFPSTTFGGRKLWMPQLVQTILLRAKKEDEYKSIVEKFGEYEDENNFEVNRARLEKLEALLSQHLKRFLKENQYRSFNYV